jgi:hypothetical protein
MTGERDTSFRCDGLLVKLISKAWRVTAGEGAPLCRASRLQSWLVGLTDAVPISELQTAVDPSLDTHNMAAPNRPRVFLEISIGNEPAGRLTIELFADQTPKTCEKYDLLSSFVV